MAMRSAVSRLSTAMRYGSMESTRGSIRYLSDDKGRVLSEEERAKEAVYIQKMEKERMEKLKKKAQKEKAEKEKEGADKINLLFVVANQFKCLLSVLDNIVMFEKVFGQDENNEIPDQMPVVHIDRSTQLSYNPNVWVLLTEMEMAYEAGN
ncbi:hypothetical protein PTKIN_Ptkin16aG0074100 [Pterospermum kingtungense]